MRRGTAALMLLLLVGVISGCGLLKDRLPTVRLEPPKARQSDAGDEQTAAAEGAAASSEAVEGEVGEPAGGGEVVEVEVTGELPKPAGGTGTRVKFVPVGAQRTLTAADLQGLSKWQLDVVRNEIYAAHGRRFQRSDLQQYFDRQTWYQPDSGFNESRLSALEKRNAEFVASYQKKQQSGGTAAAKSRPAGSRPAGGYIIADSSSRRLSRGDLAGLSAGQLELARNEIYARHGRPFKRADLQRYFRSQSWYVEDPSFTEGRLSTLEKANIETIKASEKNR